DEQDLAAEPQLVRLGGELVATHGEVVGGPPLAVDPLRDLHELVRGGRVDAHEGQLGLGGGQRDGQGTAGTVAEELRILGRRIGEQVGVAPGRQVDELRPQRQVLAVHEVLVAVELAVDHDDAHALAAGAAAVQPIQPGQPQRPRVVAGDLHRRVDGDV